VPVRSVQLAALIVLYGMLLGVVVDSFLLRRKLISSTRQRFGDKAAGVGFYGIMRALQLRRLRMPRPQVARGAFPS